MAVETDVSDKASLEALERAVIQRFGRVHVLMNNAGIGPETSIFGDQAGWDKSSASIFSASSTARASSARTCWRMASPGSSSTPAPSRASRPRRAIPPTTSPRPG